MGDKLGYRLGIDLGTTFTAAAVARGGSARILSLGVRQPEIPSVVAINGDAVLVGDAAEHFARSSPSRVVRHFKRRFGDPTPIVVAGTPWSPASLSARILRYVLAKAEESEGEAPSEVVLCHPASWSDHKLEALREAAQLADVLDPLLVAEPVAAARYYDGIERFPPGSTLVVFDLGGGTFDTTVVTTNDGFEIKGRPRGLNRLGGIDLDEAIFVTVCERAGIEPYQSGINPRSVQRLRTECRDAKELLSTVEAATVSVEIDGEEQTLDLTRTDLERILAEPLADAVRTVELAIGDADLVVADVDAVLLVGGSSRIPSVRKEVATRLGLPTVSDIYPKHSVALGSALTSEMQAEENGAQVSRAAQDQPITIHDSLNIPELARDDLANPAPSAADTQIGPNDRTVGVTIDSDSESEISLAGTAAHRLAPRIETTDGVRPSRRLLVVASGLTALAVLIVVLVAVASGDRGELQTARATIDSSTTVLEQNGTTTAPEVDFAAAARPADGGTLIWVHDQEPPDLHLDDPNNDRQITSWIRSSMIEGLYGISGSIEYYPELLDGEAAVAQNEDGSVTIEYTLRDDLSWSDGTPLTAADVRYTHDIIVEGCPIDDDGSIADGNPGGCVYLRGTRDGIELITDMSVKSDTQFSITMSQFFAGWRDLYSEIYAAHAYGDDASEVNANLSDWSNAGTRLPSSGPMVFESWDRGAQINLVRNDAYHGSRSPDARNDGVAFVDGVRIDFVGDTDAQIDALASGEAHIIMAQPQLVFAERLTSDPDFTVSSSAGPVFEHWGINVLNAHLSDPLVREALAYGIDKAEVVAGIYTPIFGGDVPPNGLGNTFWMPSQSPYEDHQARYQGRNVEAAHAKLEEAGYADSGDGIYDHPERGRLTLRVGTTGGNALRELTQQVLQAQLAQSGFEILIDNVDGGAYFGERPFSQDALAAASSGGTEGDPTIWDIAQFAWVGGPWPALQARSYVTGSASNAYGYSSTSFDSLAPVCDSTIDDVARADCYNELDRYATTVELDPNGLFMIPLTQRPSYYGYLSSVLTEAGVAPDVRGAGPLANIVDFRFVDQG